MRIVAGSLGGRLFDSPPGHRTHPMSDKMRGALFNALGDVDGLTILDAFAGSGALGFEAVSRGAKHVTAIDIDQRAISTINNSAKMLDISDRVKAIRSGVASWLETSKQEQVFDIILADPPYDDLQQSTLQILIPKLKPGALFVLSWPGQETAPDLHGLSAVQQNGYGDSQLVFYRSNL